MTTILRAAHQMEHFIREITNLVQNVGSKKGIDAVLPTIKQWATEREYFRNMIALRATVSEILYGKNPSVTDQKIVFLYSYCEY